MQTINLDLSVRSVIPLLCAKQGDVGRKFKAIVTDGGAACAALAGAAVSVWYSGASGEGNYTDIGADSAVSISGNEITVGLITQMLTNYGAGTLCLVINTADGDQLGTWNIPYMVEPVPGMGSAAAQAYFTAFSQAIQNLPYPDASLSAAGKAADAAAVGERFANMKAADIGAAPVGLVTKALSVADEAALDAALSAELAAMAENTAQFLVISPKSGALFGGVGMLCELYKRSASGYGTAKFTGYGSESPDVLYKTLWAGVWQPLEWENPPMVVGVEYRTTERWNGKAVYRKLLSATTSGTVGNTGSVTDLEYSHGISGLEYCLSCTGFNGQNLLPNISANYGGTVVNKVTPEHIILRINKDTWSGTFYIEMRYTKS